MLKYRVIRSKAQYKEYTRTLEALVRRSARSRSVQDEIDLLTLLIEKWDDEHDTFLDLDPVQLLRSFLDDHGLKPKDLVKLLRVSKGYVSDVLNYKKAFSKILIRELADYFKVSQEAFNRPYPLKTVRTSRRIGSMARKRKMIA